MISYVPGLCGGLVILKDDGLPFVLSDQKTFYQRNKEKYYLNGSAFSRFSIWCRECSVTHEDLNRILQTSPLLLNRSSSTRKNRSKRPGQQHITTVLRDFRRKKRDLHSSMSAASQSLSQDVSSDQPEPTVHQNDEVEVSGSPTSTPHHLKDDGLPFVLFDQKIFLQRNKEQYYLSGSAFSRFWNKKIQTTPFGVENALSLMKT